MLPRVAAARLGHMTCVLWSISDVFTMINCFSKLKLQNSFYLTEVLHRWILIRRNLVGDGILKQSEQMINLQSIPHIGINLCTNLLYLSHSKCKFNDSGTKVKQTENHWRILLQCLFACTQANVATIRKVCHLFRQLHKIFHYQRAPLNDKQQHYLIILSRFAEPRMTRPCLDKR